MTYADKGELVEILKQHGLFAKKDYGQNFLVNSQVLQKIINAAEISDKDYIIEVGPGLGFLTKELLAKAGHVRAIELDRAIIPYIIENFSSNPKFELEQGTALKARLPNHQYKLVANIPYYITSPLLTHFLQPKTQDEKKPSLIVILVQKEVADKICAKAGDHTILSLMTQTFGKPETISKVGKSDFYPQPNVDSAILKVTPYETPIIKNLTLFKQIISISFHQKRKTLNNSIKYFTQKPREEIDKIFNDLNLEPGIRPQNLSLQDWQNLIEKI
jgi:16S rRNA (adenine1518-N6/adenine1519-N6)-dimethyltransferase